MQSLTDRSKGKQICMHDRMGRDGEADGAREAKTEANSVTSLESVCACVESRCECTRACAGQEGGLRAKQ